MKKLTALCLVLAAVLAMGSVGFAAELLTNGLHPTYGKDSHTLAIPVEGEVAPYASIYLEEAPERIFWSGRAHERNDAQATFRIRSNTPVSLAVDFDNLETVQDEVTYKLATFLWVVRDGETNRLLDAGKWRGGQYSHEPSYPGVRFNSNVQGVANNLYRMTIQGVLGTIEQQAAGEYTTEVRFTIAAAI